MALESAPELLTSWQLSIWMFVNVSVVSRVM